MSNPLVSAAELFDADIVDNYGTVNLSNMSNMEILDFIALTLTKEVKSYFAFKGGYTLTKMVPNARMTQDVDLSVQAREDYEDFKIVLKDIALKFINAGIIDEYNIKPEISERTSGGIKFYKNGKLIAGVDIGLHQLVFGIGKLDFTFAEVNAFKPERMLADKIAAILSASRFRRIKDIYDVFCITSTFDLDYDLLLQLVELRIVDKSLWNNIPFNEVVITEFKRAYDKFRVISYITGEQLDKSDFNDVVLRFYNLVMPIKIGDKRSKWEAKNGVWV